MMLVSEGGLAVLVACLIAAVVIALVLLEGRRQARIYGRASGRPNLLGVGLLELQRHLQPDRRVEALLEQEKGETAAAWEDEHGEGRADTTDGARTPPEIQASRD